MKRQKHRNDPRASLMGPGGADWWKNWVQKSWETIPLSTNVYVWDSGPIRDVPGPFQILTTFHGDVRILNYIFIYRWARKLEDEGISTNTWTYKFLAQFPRHPICGFIYIPFLHLHLHRPSSTTKKVRNVVFVFWCLNHTLEGRQVNMYKGHLKPC